MLSLFLGALPSTKLPVREGFASRREQRALVIRVRGRIPLPRECFLARETAGALGPTPASRQEGGLARVSPYASRDEQSPCAGRPEGGHPTSAPRHETTPQGLASRRSTRRIGRQRRRPTRAPLPREAVGFRRETGRLGPYGAPSSCIGGSADGARRGREGPRTTSDPSPSGRSSSGSPGGPDLSPELRVPPSNESAAGDAVVVGRQLGVELLQDV